MSANLGAFGTSSQAPALSNAADAVSPNTALLERGVLRGPADADLEKLRALGWNPEKAGQTTIARADEEKAQRQRFDEGPDNWRRGRLRDAIAARELLIELFEPFKSAFAVRGLDPTNILKDPKSGRAFLQAMPSTDVAMELKVAWHKNRDKSWLPNDIHDMDALALAVPYCDVVVTENACHHALTAVGFGERMHTALLRDLLELPKTLSDWKAWRPEAA